MPGLGSLSPTCARADRAASPAGGCGMSAERPAKGLSMGLQALLGDAARPAPAPGSAEASASRGGVGQIEVARIRPNPHQPRSQFDDEALDELADAIHLPGDV